MRTDDFDYNLPEELIAQAPAEPRDSCRLLVVDRKGSETGTPLEHGGTVEHRIFRDIIDYIEPGDVLVINKTRVMPARLIGRKAGSGGGRDAAAQAPRGRGSAGPCLGVPGQTGQAPEARCSY